MEFDNEFSVNSPIDTVWDTLMDVQQVAPCMPGAEVLEQTGDNSYKVAVKVRLGPVSMQYRGDVEIVDTDPGAHTAKMVAKATEARGQGTANAEIGMQLAEQNGSTHARLTTDLRLSGRAAAMGQGIVKDVAAKLTETFAENLAAKLQGAPAETAAGWSPTEGETPISERETAPAEAAAGTAGAAPSATAEPSGATKPEEIPEALEREGAEAATGRFTTPDRAEALKTQPEAPRKPPEQEPSPPAGAAELPALDIAASVLADRLRKPSVLAGAVAVIFLAGFAVGRLVR
jgi:carbon monoxide dehydrogenase subunit G